MIPCISWFLLPSATEAFRAPGVRSSRLQPGTAAALLAAALGPGEAALLGHVLCLLRRALAPRHAAASGLTRASLAVLLAELWFPALPAGLAAGGGGVTPRDVAALQAAAEAQAGIAMRRIRFVEQLLEGAAAEG